MEEKSEKQELDLLILFQKIFNFFFLIIKKIVEFFGYLLRLIYRYKYIFLLFIIVAIAISIYKTTGDRKMYKAEIILKVNDGDSFLFSEMINNLNQYIKDNDFTGLARILNTSVENTKKISFLKPYFMIDLNNDSTVDLIDYDNKYELSDTVNIRVSDRIVVSSGIKDINIFPELKKILLDYFNSSKYLVLLNDNRLSQLKEKELFYDRNIRELDSLQRIEYFEKKSNRPEVKMDQTGLLMYSEKQMFYKDKMKILQEKEKVSKELTENSEIVKVIIESQPSSKSINSLSKTFLQYISIFTVLFFIVIILFQNRKCIINYLKNEELKES
jgi:hypothetical protein